MMKALTYNLTLWLPIVMFLVWAATTIIRDKTFAEHVIALDRVPDIERWRLEAACLAATNAFYDTEGRLSMLKYINVVWKHKAMFYKAISLCLLLDYIQHDDGSNYSGKFFDNMGDDFLLSFVLALLGALLFDYVFLRYVFRGRLAKSPSIPRMLVSVCIAWAVLTALGALTISTVVSALGDAMKEDGMQKPIEYVVGFIFSPASFLWAVYAFTVLQTKVALIPAILLLLLSSMSFALPSAIYIVMHQALRHDRLRVRIASLARQTHEAQESLKAKSVRFLDYLQKAYWIYLLAVILRAAVSGHVL